MGDEKIYVQYTEPDKNQLARLLAYCKGLSRTMAQMGEDTGLSASMLSRISNGNLTKPLPEETLRAIYKGKTEDCDVTMDDLYRANGMITADERNRMAHGMESRRMAEALQERTQQIIINELFSRGYAVKADVSHSMAGRSIITDRRTDSDRGDLPIRYDLGVVLPELHDLSEWVFIIYTMPAQLPSYMADRSPEMNARTTIRRMLQMRSNIFLIDAWQPERLAGLKYSWVFADEDIYNAFRDYMKVARLNNAMSTILVDVNDRVVLKEEWLNCPMKDDYASLFKDERDKRPGTDYEYRPRKYFEPVQRVDSNEEEDTE